MDKNDFQGHNERCLGFQLINRLLYNVDRFPKGALVLCARVDILPPALVHIFKKGRWLGVSAEQTKNISHPMKYEFGVEKGTPHLKGAMSHLTQCHVCRWQPYPSLFGWPMELQGHDAELWSGSCSGQVTLHHTTVSMPSEHMVIHGLSTELCPCASTGQLELTWQSLGPREAGSKLLPATCT